MLGLLSTFIVAATGLAPDPGIGQFRGEPLLPPASALAVPSPTAYAAEGGVVFVNFDGAMLTSAPEDARTNQTQIGFEGPFAAYGAGTKREAVMQSLRTDWAAYDIAFTETRPADGDYTMAMVGPTNFTDGSLGIALLDCGDAWTHNNIVYAFHHADDGYSAAATATTIGQEIAHSFGLEHVEDPADVMHPYNLGGDPAFLDECVDIVPASFGILCKAQHKAQCGVDSAQNAHAELLEMFGSSAPDTTAPTVRIMSPLDGDVFEIGATFEIEVYAADDEEVVRIELRDPQRMLGEDTTAPWGWELESASEGEYRFSVVAIDAAGNEAVSEEIVVAIAAGGDPGLPGGSDDGGGESDDGVGESGDGSDGGRGYDESDGADAGQADDVRNVRYHAYDGMGCACRSTPTGGMPVLLLGFLGLGLAVRRRR